MRVGKLRHLLEIVAPVVARHADGGFENRPLVVLRAWGSVDPVDRSGDESLVAAATEAGATHVVTIRYAQGLTPKHEIRHGARVLGIVDIQDPTGRRRELRLLCREVVA